jgi:hypothetical protein
MRMTKPTAAFLAVLLAIFAAALYSRPAYSAPSGKEKARFDKTTALSTKQIPEALRPAAFVAMRLCSAGLVSFFDSDRKGFSSEEAMIFYFAYHSALGEVGNPTGDEVDAFMNKTFGLDEVRDYSGVPVEDDGEEMFYRAEDGRIVCSYLPDSPTHAHSVTGYGGDETGKGEYTLETTSYYDIEERGDAYSVDTWRFEGVGPGMKILGVNSRSPR